MSDTATASRDESNPNPFLIRIHGHWNGPIYQFEVSSSAIGDLENPDERDPRLWATNYFDEAVRKAFEHAQEIGLDRVRFMICSDDTHGQFG